MANVESPSVSVHRKLVAKFGYADISLADLYGFIPGCRESAIWTLDETISILADMKFIRIDGGTATIMKRMVVHRRHDPYDVYIGHGTIWGNTFTIGPDGNRTEVIAKHARKVMSDPALMDRIRKELRGKVLGCSCSPLPCHGDILAEIANNEEYNG